ncbi:FAD-dependent monooxygenase [Kibdelosporangium aridum]|uniref:FAD-dependent monooxygenase n=1 Tax=Kibdelosporangium aridum TaxID=2030 RepID=UPI00068FB8E4|nr:FAD-dependent monooxygenase [Kibdelosporangium aridum]
MTGRQAVVAGAGIAGIATAIALSRSGWRVRVFERSSTLECAGGGIGITPNGLRALDSLGVGDQVRARAIVQRTGGIRTPSGRWIARTDLDFIKARFGLPVLALHRADLIAALAEGLGDVSVHFGVRAAGVRDAGEHVLLTDSEEVPADVVIGADGIRSAVARSMFPGHAGVKYAGYTSWRVVVPRPDVQVVAAETWGRGTRFAILPLPGGMVHCSALANAPSRQRHADEKAELRRRFGGWHEPIPQLLANIRPGSVLHHDIEEQDPMLPDVVQGHVALVGDAAHAMTPNLGSASLALEDAVVLGHALAAQDIPSALAAYARARSARVRNLARRSRRIGQLGQLSAPFAVAARDVGFWLGGLVPVRLTGRALESVMGWQPPR